MISVRPDTFVMLYLLLTLTTIFLFWIFHHRKSKTTPPVPRREELYLCEYCACLYMADKEKPVTKCPECKSFNKENRYTP